MGFSFLLLKKFPFILVFLNQPDYDVKKKGVSFDLHQDFVSPISMSAFYVKALCIYSKE